MKPLAFAADAGHLWCLNAIWVGSAGSGLGRGGGCAG